MKYYTLEVTESGKFTQKEVLSMTWEGYFYFSENVMCGTDCTEKDLEKVKKKLIKKCIQEAVKESKKAQEKVTKLQKLWEK